MEKLKQYLSNPYIILALGTLFMILSSAKWTVTLAPWIGLVFLLNFTRRVKLWRVIVFGILAMFISTGISGYNVVPLPMPFYPILVLIIAIKSILPFLLDRLTKAQERGFVGTLIFPAACVGLEFFDSFTGGNTWGSIAHTQYKFQTILQVASVFGPWGVSFLVYWFASIINWLITKNWQWQQVRTGVLTAASIYFLALSFGLIRITASNMGEKETVKIAGVTADYASIMTTLYHDEFGKTIEIAPETAQTSPLLQELNRAMPPFIADPFANKYQNTRAKMDENLNDLFERSAQLADEAVKIVAWSEAIGWLTDRDEEDIIQRGQQLARDKNFYLIMGLGVIHPGPLDGEHLFMTNKTISLTPEGEIANVYLKSNPVPFAEQDYGSDDIIPVIETPYGKLSPVICYDADFNPFMKQTGNLETDILLVPSGDWKAIAPYHSYMAAMRGIENGVSVVRPVSRGTSLATDAYGNVLGSSDFFTSEDKVMTVSVPTQGINTIYNRIGDILAYACWGCCIFYIGETVYRFIRRKYLGSVGILERWNIGLHRERKVVD